MTAGAIVTDAIKGMTQMEYGQAHRYRIMTRTVSIVLCAKDTESVTASCAMNVTEG